MSSEPTIIQELHKKIYDMLADAEISMAERVGILEGVKYCLQRYTEEME